MESSRALIWPIPPSGEKAPAPAASQGERLAPAVCMNVNNASYCCVGSAGPGLHAAVEAACSALNLALTQSRIAFLLPSQAAISSISFENCALMDQ